MHLYYNVQHWVGGGGNPNLDARTLSTIIFARIVGIKVDGFTLFMTKSLFFRTYSKSYIESE